MLQTMLKISNSSNSDSSIFSVKFYKIIYKQMEKKLQTYVTYIILLHITHVR